jgi:hypothetical protein
VILSIDARAASRGDVIWSCDSDEVIAAFQAQAVAAVETASHNVSASDCHATAVPTSKLAQIRALREQSVDEV